MAKETTFEHPPKGHFGLIAYDSVNDRWQAVHVDADGNLQVDITAIVDGQIHLYAWDGDSWEALQVDANKYLKVTLPLEEALGARGYQYTGSAWVRSNLLWGYHDNWIEGTYEQATSDGTWVWNATTVPTGEVWVANCCLGVNYNRDPTNIRFMIRRNTNNYYLDWVNAPGAVTPFSWNGSVVLKAGDILRVDIGGCITNDYLAANVLGYKMDVNM